MKTRPSFLQRLTGASWDLLAHCSTTCRSAFANIGAAMLITALFSATVLSYSIGTVGFKNPWTIPLIALFWFPFIIVLDRTVVLANSNASRWFRAVVIITLSLFHTLLFDSIWLADDLAAEMKTDYNAKVSEARTGAAQATAPLFARIAAIDSTNLSLQREKASSADDRRDELWGHGNRKQRGRGKILIGLEKITAERDAVVDVAIANNAAAIPGIRAEIDRINTGAAADIDAMVKPGDRGLKGGLEALYQMVFIKKDPTSIILFLVALAVVCFFEGLPWIAKMVWKSDTDEYFDQAAKAKGRGELRAQEFDTMERDEITHIFTNAKARKNGKYTHEFTVITGEALAKASQTKLRFRKAEALDRLAVFEEFLTDVGVVEERLREEFPDLFEEFVADEIAHTRSSFKAWLKKDHYQNPEDNA